MELTQQQIEAAQACGCTFIPASEAQVARLSMQRRIFIIGGKPFVAARDDDGFHETHATLARLIEAHETQEQAEAPDAGTMVQEAAAVAPVSHKEIAGAPDAGGVPKVQRRRATNLPKPPQRSATHDA
jgi:hypothetical protein